MLIDRILSAIALSASQSLQFGKCCAKKKVGRESSERQLSTPAQTARAGVRRRPASGRKDR